MSSGTGSVSHGSSIGPFQIGEEIGKGSFAVVHRGTVDKASLKEDPSTSGRRNARRDVAIKIVTRRKLTQKLLDNLEGEIAILKTVSHPNIVELIDCLKTESHIYLIMDFSAGGDLSQYIRRKGAMAEGIDVSASFLSATKKLPHPSDGGLNETVVRSFLEQLASAMEFMRVRNIVHRDIKPQNLLLQPPSPDCLATGHPPGIPQMKVADFGFARSLPAASLAETLCGSPLYMAPEILRYEKYDAKADLWSIGAVTFEMVVGKPPFRASNHVELLRRIEKNEDRIRFPDERSEATWLRDVEKRRETGEVVTADQEKRGPTPVAEDIKALVRGLLKRKAIERMSFEDFFGSSVVLDARPQAAETNKSVQPSPSAEPPAKESLASRSSLRPVSPPRPTPGPALPMQDPSPARVQAPPPMQALPPLPKFAPKYVVGREERADRGDKAQAVPQQSKPASQATAGSSAVQQKPESKPSGIGAQLKEPRTPKHAAASSPSPSPSPAAELSDEDSQYVMVEKRSIEINALADELGQSPNSQRPSQPLAAQAQGAVSAAVRLARRPSRLTRLSSGFSAAATIGENSGTPQNVGSPTDRIGPSSPRSAQSGPSNFARDLPSPPPAVGTPGSRDTSATSALSSSPSAPFALPAGVRRQSFIGRKASSSGAGIPKLADVKKETSTSPANQPVAASAPSQSSSLARTLASASQKMFGVPSGLSLLGAAALMRTAAPVVARMMPLPVADPTSTSPPLKSGEAYASSVAAKIKSGESELLQRLDDLSQKAFVLSEFADSKMTGVDASSSANNEGGNASSLVEQYAAALARQRSSSMSSSAASGLGFIDPVLDVNNANESLAVYIRGLGFLQKGIELVRSFVESRSVSSASAYSVSAEVNDAVHYLRKRFNVTFEKAEIARSKTVAAPGSTSANRHSSSPSSGSSTSPPPLAASTVNRLIYDKAMEIARAAALDELENNHKTVTINAIGSSPDVNATGAAPSGAPSSSSPNATSQTAQWDIHACLLAYETAGIMLSSLLETTVTSSQVEETAALTVEPFIKSINHRSQILRSRITSATSAASPE